MSRRRAWCAVLALLLCAPGCRPAAFDTHRADYERLVMLHLQAPEPGLWFTSTAPDEARRLMLRLGIDAVLGDRQNGWVQLRHGGGYAPESGYFFLLARADTSTLPEPVARLRPLGDGWHAYGR